MPTIRIDYDEKKVTDAQIIELSKALQHIVHEVTGIDDVFVYANPPRIAIKNAPIEIYIQISAQKITDIDALFEDIKKPLSQWKREYNFPIPLNMTLMPMQWKFEIDI